MLRARDLATPGPARQSPPPGWGRSAGEEAERTVGYELWLLVHDEMPGLWNEFQLEGAGSRRLLANGPRRNGRVPLPEEEQRGDLEWHPASPRRAPGRQHAGGPWRHGVERHKPPSKAEQNPDRAAPVRPTGRPARARARRAASARRGSSSRGRNLDFGASVQPKPRRSGQSTRARGASSGIIRHQRYQCCASRGASRSASPGPPAPVASADLRHRRRGAPPEPEETSLRPSRARHAASSGQIRVSCRAL
jgi:hypothetical protein